MPRIELYQQQTLPQSGNMPRASAVQLASAAGSLGGIGAVGMQAAEGMFRQANIEAERQRQVLEKQQEEDGKLEAAKTISNARLQWTEQSLKLKEAAQPGAAGFTPGLVKSFDEYSAKTVEQTQNPIAKKYINDGLLNLRTQLGQDALHFEAQARIDNKVNTLEAGVNQAAQAVVAAPYQRSAVLAEQLRLIDSIDIPPHQKEALKERALQTIDTSALNAEITGARNSTKSMDGLLERMGKGEFAGVKAESLAAAEGRIGNFKNTLILKAEAAERRRMAGLEQQERRLSWYVENGKDIPPEEFNAFASASKGTPYADVAKGILVEQKQISALSTLPPQQMVTQVKALEDSYGPNPSKEQIMHVDKLKRFVNGSIKQLNDSPLQYAASREGATVQPLDLNQPDTWAQTLGSRTQILTEAARSKGVSPKGLLPEEAAAMSNALKRASPQVQAQYLGKLRSGFGDDGVFKATMQQIAVDNPVVAAAGVAASQGLSTDRGRALSELMLRGNALLRQDVKEDGKPVGKVMPMPSDKDLGTAFSGYEKDAFAGKEQARNTALQTAKAIYAAKASEEGDHTGVLNSNRWDAAMKLATGGIEKHNGRAIVLPYGLGYGDFKNRLTKSTEALAKSGAVADTTASKLRDLPLENVGDGRYIMRVGDGVMVDKTGRPVILDLTK